MPEDKRFKNLSNEIQKKLFKILDEKDKGYVYIEAHLRSSDDSDFRLDMGIVKDLNIIQDFDRRPEEGASTWADEIHLTLEIRPINYINLMKMKNLYCDLKFIEADIKDPDKPGKIINTFRFIVIIMNKEDLLKKYNYKDIVPQEDYHIMHHEDKLIELDLQLIDDSVYRRRKVLLNGIYRFVTIEEMILVGAKFLDVEKVYIVPPDNKKVYTNFVIPPMLSITEYFRWLQLAPGLGVYEKDLSFYVHDNTLFVYPRYETNPLLNPVVHMIKVAENLLSGVDNYSKVIDDELNIILANHFQEKDLSDEHLENVGNGLLVQHQEKMLDSSHNHLNDVNVEIRDSNISLISFNPAKGIADEAYQPIFKVSQDNIFSQISYLSAGELTEVATLWKHAKPFSILPGQKIILHYDGENSTYTTRTGIITSIAYNISRAKRIGQHWIFGVIAPIRMRLSNEINEIIKTKDGTKEPKLGLESITDYIT